MADQKISALTDGGGFQAGDEIPVARSGGNDRVSPIGVPVLVYRYTVTGSDKASIDTGVDTANAGSNDWTNCDLLEIIFNGRTDEAVNGSLVNMVLNNDASAVYDRGWGRISNTSLSASAAAGESAIRGGDVPGTSVANTSVAGTLDFKIPNPTGTVFNKTITGVWGMTSPGDTNQALEAVVIFYYRPATPAAITRLKVLTDTAGKKLKVGSQLLIYKRLSS